ncbi:MAG: hypothetical protein IJ710_05660 [Prevotella sp.]|nr:hypothetical protein [Prevotella sp.]
MTTQRYHLPHNAIRIDEFDFLLGCINTERPYYTYAELRSLFLFEQIRQRKLESFHERYHQNLTTHSDPEVSALYARIVQMSADQLQPEDTDALLDVQYTQAKTFKQVWNETIRDYTEFFAFLGLLPSYYKGRRGDDGKRHYVSGLLCRYRNGEASMHDILMGFKYRNACKNEANFDMYSIEVRPFYIALRALQHYNAAGYHIVDPHIISAVVTFSQDENASLQKLLCDFDNPTLPLEDYQNLGLFPQDQHEFQKWVEEARRASSLLKPYLEALQAVSVRRAGRSYKYVIQPEHFHLDKTPERSVFCDGTVGHYRLTPMLGKVINRCQHFADIAQERRIGFNSLFDDNFTAQEKVGILKELQAQGAVKAFDVAHSEAVLNIRRCQLAINPYCDMDGH